MADDRIVDVTVSAEGIRQLAAALRAEEDGRALRRELAKNMRGALRPAAARAKSAIMAMPSHGSGSAPGLRTSIAKRIRPEIKLGGNWTGARVKSKKIPGIRNFANAPKRTNRASGWRTQTFGHEPWRHQYGKVKWFDRSFEGIGPQSRQAVFEAMEEMARRIAARS